MYEFSYLMSDAGKGIWDIGFGVVYLFFLLLGWGMGIGVYVLQSLGMYTIAKRRGIKKPWLSWIPVGNLWILGSISDQYRYVAKGQVKNKRKALLVLQIVAAGAYVVLLIMLFSLLFQIAGSYIGAMNSPVHFNDAYFAGIISTAVTMLIPVFAVLGVSIAMKILQYMALYDVYRSCEPGNSTIYLVLSIFFDIAAPIILFLYRNRDDGMPPRKQPVVEQASDVSDQDFEQ